MHTRISALAGGAITNRPLVHTRLGRGGAGSLGRNHLLMRPSQEVPSFQAPAGWERRSPASRALSAPRFIPETRTAVDSSRIPPHRLPSPSPRSHGALGGPGAAGTFLSCGADSSRPSWRAFVPLLASIACGRSHRPLGPRSEPGAPGSARRDSRSELHTSVLPARPPSPRSPGFQPFCQTPPSTEGSCCSWFVLRPLLPCPTCSLRRHSCPSAVIPQRPLRNAREPPSGHRKERKCPPASSRDRVPAGLSHPPCGPSTREE